MKLLLGCCLVGLLAIVPSLSGEKSPLPLPPDWIKREHITVHVAPINVGAIAGPMHPTIIPTTGDTATESDTVPWPRVGDRIVIRGSYALTTQAKARLALFFNPKNRKVPQLPLDLPSLEVKKGAGDFELSCPLEREGTLWLAFVSIPDGKRFPGSSYVTEIFPAWAGMFRPEKSDPEPPAEATPRSR